MHLLLPPSEAKRPGGRGRPISSRPDDSPLGQARDTALAALATLLAGDRDTAIRALDLPAGVAEAALAADRRAASSPTLAALQRYAGVVYDGLDLASLTPAERRLAARCCHVFSGLFGVVRGDEPIPDYRVPAKAVLPGLGIVGTWWRPVLTALLPDVLARGLVIDLRSSDYRAMWRPGPSVAGRVVDVRIVSPTPRGGLGVVSYASKLSKGRLAAALVRAAAGGRPPEGAADVVAAWRTCTGADVGATAEPAAGATGVELVTLAPTGLQGGS